MEHTSERSPSREQMIHRALGDRSRVRILASLRTAPEPLDAAELADRVGLHPNTVRSHLRVLSEADLVTSQPEERTRPGRPRLVYEAKSEVLAEPAPAGYRLLAEILASSLTSTEEDPTERAEEAGRAWGSYLVDRRPPFTPSSAEEDIETVLRLLDEFGFEPALESSGEGHTLLMQRCPFGEVAETYRKVVCAVHLGLMQGALTELGAHVEADDLQPFARPGVCAAHLEEIGAN